LSKAKEISQQLETFLEAPLDVEAMVRQVDGSLYRNRSK
jgi:hypothetical protein